MTVSQEFDEEHVSRLGKNHAWSANAHNSQINPQKITSSELRFIRNEWSPSLLINYTLIKLEIMVFKESKLTAQQNRSQANTYFTVKFVELTIMSCHRRWHGSVGIHAWNGGSIRENETEKLDCRHQNWKEVHQQDIGFMIYIYALP
jgi:hypothetical protein